MFVLSTSLLLAAHLSAGSKELRGCWQRAPRHCEELNVAGLHSAFEKGRGRDRMTMRTDQEENADSKNDRFCLMVCIS